MALGDGADNQGSNACLALRQLRSPPYSYPRKDSYHCNPPYVAMVNLKLTPIPGAFRASTRVEQSPRIRPDVDHQQADSGGTGAASQQAGPG